MADNDETTRQIEQLQQDFADRDYMLTKSRNMLNGLRPQEKEISNNFLRSAEIRMQNLREECNNWDANKKQLQERLQTGQASLKRQQSRHEQLKHYKMRIVNEIKKLDQQLLFMHDGMDVTPIVESSPKIRSPGSTALGITPSRRIGSLPLSVSPAPIQIKQSVSANISTQSTGRILGNSRLTSYPHKSSESRIESDEECLTMDLLASVKRSQRQEIKQEVTQSAFSPVQQQMTSKSVKFRFKKSKLFHE